MDTAEEIDRLIHLLADLKDLLELAAYMNKTFLGYIQDKNLLDDFDKWTRERNIEKMH